MERLDISMIIESAELNVSLDRGENWFPHVTTVTTAREVEAVAQPFSEVGMSLTELSRLMIAPGPGLEELAPDRMRLVLGRAADVARGLEDTAREA